MRKVRSGNAWLGSLLPAVGLLILGLLLSYNQGLEPFDRFLYDSLSRHITRPPADNIVIIAIDEESLAKYGQWPWPRHIHGDLIDKLSVGGAKVIGFDIIISETGRAGSQDDTLFSEAVARSGRVIMPVFAEWNPGRNRLQVRKPIPAVSAAAAGLGHVDFELDADGIMRRAFLNAGLGFPEWNAFSLEMLLFAGFPASKPLPGRRNSSLDSASPSNWVRDYEILLPFTGKPGQFKRISYAQFLDPDFDPYVVRDKFVLVGTTASGLSDALPTPVSGESLPMSGVEINANLLDTLENGLAVLPISTAGRISFTAFLLVFPLLAFALLSHKTVQIVAGSFLVFIPLTAALLLVKMHIWYPPAAAMLILLLSYPVWVWNRLAQLVGKLFQERDHADITLKSIGDGVITTDASCRVKYMNPAAERLTGYSRREAEGCRLETILRVAESEEEGEPFAFVRQCIETADIVQPQEEAVFHDKSGRKHIACVTAGPLKDRAGKAMGAVLGISDVTEKNYALEKLTYQATHDFITNLPNRSLLFDRLSQAIFRTRRSEKSVAILFLDLDNFKKVNDQLGHSGGDRLLQMVGERLKKACRSGDTVARLGGDEFVVLLEEVTDLRIAATLAEKFIHILQPPFTLDDHELFLTASIGISVFPKDGTDVDMLMKNADIAMYEVKKSGRNNYLFFSDRMNELIQKRLRLEAELRNALNRAELRLYYQPQIRLSDNRVIGVEALLRWVKDDGRIIPPTLFIPVAEESGLILPLSEWVLQTACGQAKIWQEQISESLRMSINISPRHFREGNLPGQLIQVIRDTGINPQNIDLEITEGLIMQDIDRSVTIMRDFKLLGGTVSIDDFGTGYSSLSYLKQFPLDKLKIDKSFIDDIDRNRKDEGLAKTIITMGHGLGLTVAAEGVETRSQLEKLRQLGCDVIQGFYYSHPLPPEALTALLEKSQFINK